MCPHRTQWLTEWFDESENDVNHQGLASNYLLQLKQK